MCVQFRWLGNLCLFLSYRANSLSGLFNLFLLLLSIPSLYLTHNEQYHFYLEQIAISTLISTLKNKMLSHFIEVMTDLNAEQIVTYQTSCRSEGASSFVILIYYWVIYSLNSIYTGFRKIYNLSLIQRILRVWIWSCICEHEFLFSIEKIC